MINYTIIDNSTITYNISDNAYRIYNFLLSMCYNKDHCYPSQKYISERLCKSVRTVQRGIQECFKAGLILRIKRRGSISNVYTLLKTSTSNVVNTVKTTIDKVKKSYTKKKSLFNDFPQRKYDYKELEQQLLGNAVYDPKKLE
ncbi:helix-turn-helix domain-containing protein [Clostridium autoethanogenum]|uniref:Helix-turn-helix domain-containing protein n=1 Tax=Clostridium autoethanogenum DSM 10061 TaxID=1341692 RepID=A0ABM5NZI0_9CLOT|nr:helix-turn-helix domain-containing protein [Clostridium autoethanogenum]AGY77952.1 helix-turn-helix domain-containing protein [Clostridium autoethanogenum DSM 10061]ALU38086.1 HTH domain-containing protein [Clostridium autoethanogenum DSM 10061]OVY50850.1 hypothetical protein WX72_02011 [Clostridium autoethanogenum]